MDVKGNLKVVIGAGGQNNNPGWLHTEEKDLSLLLRKDWQEKFSRNSLEAILAEHVWEHLTYEQGVEAVKICFEFLKPGGYVRCAVPDGYFNNAAYQEVVQVGGPGLKDHPAASHKIVHNYKTIRSMFEEAGFRVELLEFCDEKGDFFFSDWDEKEGFIYRSKRFDHRNEDGQLGFVSLIVDAIK